jgi:hypothetical protein
VVYFCFSKDIGHHTHRCESSTFNKIVWPSHPTNIFRNRHDIWWTAAVKKLSSSSIQSPCFKISIPLSLWLCSHGALKSYWKETVGCSLSYHISIHHRNLMTSQNLQQMFYLLDHQQPRLNINQILGNQQCHLWYPTHNVWGGRSTLYLVHRKQL